MNLQQILVQHGKSMDIMPDYFKRVLSSNYGNAATSSSSSSPVGAEGPTSLFRPSTDPPDGTDVAHTLDKYWCFICRTIPDDLLPYFVDAAVRALKDLSVGNVFNRTMGGYA